MKPNWNYEGMAYLTFGVPLAAGEGSVDTTGILQGFASVYRTPELGLSGE